MKEIILQKSVELFLNQGFKSVTMDDIAQDLGMSKKTIYHHFRTKTKLIEACTEHVFALISTEIKAICALEDNPIAEIWKIKNVVMEHLKEDKSPIQYQLQKYYPSIASSLKKKQFEVMNTCLVRNLKRGIALGLYRDTIHIDFIARVYFNTVLAIKNKHLFPEQDFSLATSMNQFLDYHLRGICTTQGVHLLNHYLISKQDTQ